MVDTVLGRMRAARDLPASYVRTSYRARRSRPHFAEVEVYCSFIGYARSGHSLLGFLLDAHPDVLLAHELDAYRYLRAGFRREQLFQLLLDRAEEVEAQGRVQTGYRYEVPGQWQGRFRSLRVIGHKKGSSSTRQLDASVERLDQLRKTVRVPLRFIHVTRNPFDNISSVAARADSLERSAAGYFELCAMNERLMGVLEPDELTTVRHEALVADPRGTLSELCDFLSVSVEASWLEACAELVFPTPRRTREGQDWSDALVASVSEQMRRFPFLDGYSFED